MTIEWKAETLTRMIAEIDGWRLCVTRESRLHEDEFYMWSILSEAGGARHPGWATYRNDEIVRYSFTVIGNAGTLEDAQDAAERSYHLLKKVSTGEKDP